MFVHSVKHREVVNSSCEWDVFTSGFGTQDTERKNAITKRGGGTFGIKWIGSDWIDPGSSASFPAHRFGQFAAASLLVSRRVWEERFQLGH